MFSGGDWMRCILEVATFLLVLCFAAFLNAPCKAVCEPKHSGIANFQSEALLGSTSQESNLYISGSEIYRIQDSVFNLNGTIFVQNDSTLDVENATLNLILADGAYDVITATDSAHIYITNSTLNLTNPDLGRVGFSCFDQSEMDINESTIEGTGFSANAFNTSTCNIEDINTTMLKGIYNDQGVGTSASSSLYMKNLNVSFSGLSGDSSQYLVNSYEGELITGYDPGHVTLNMTNSTVEDSIYGGMGSCQYSIRDSTLGGNFIIGPNSKAYISRSTAVDLWVGGSPSELFEPEGNSTLTLVDSSVDVLYVDGNSTVILTGCSWNLIAHEGKPVILVGNWFFGASMPGIAGVPYTWVFPIETLFIAAVIVAISASIIVVHSLRAKRRKEHMQRP